MESRRKAIARESTFGPAGFPQLLENAVRFPQPPASYYWTLTRPFHGRSPLQAGLDALVGGLSVKAHPKGLRDLKHRGEARVTLRTECPIQALSAEAGVPGDL